MACDKKSARASAEFQLPHNTREIDYEKDLGAPGEFPYTRGIYPNMYRGRLWTMRQYAGYATAEESNARYKYLLAQGTTGLSVAFDLPTQIGLDSDDPLSLGEVGKVGVAIDSLEDMERLFAGIPLDEVSTSMTINATAAILLSLYLAVARKQGVPFSKVRGTLQNDILKEYIARGTYIYPPAPSLRLVTDIFAYCAREVPNWNTISISGYHIREAGSTAVQEVAFTLADGITYVEAALAAGLEVDDFAPRLSFFFNAHNNLLEEIAKFRAARRLWGAHHARSFQSARSAFVDVEISHADGRLVIDGATAGSECGADDDSGAGGGAWWNTVVAHNSMDEALALPTEAAARVALRTQQVIAYESGVAETADPLAVLTRSKHLTDEIEEKAREYLKKLRQWVGCCVQLNWVTCSVRYRKRRIVTRRRRDAGAGGSWRESFQLDDGAAVPLLRIDPALEQAQVERIQALACAAIARATESALNKLEQAAATTKTCCRGFSNASRRTRR